MSSNSFDQSTMTISIMADGQETLVPMGDLPLPRIVIPLSEEVVRLSNEFGGVASPHRVKKYRIAIRDLTTWLQNNAPEVHTISGISRQHLYGFLNTQNLDGETCTRRLLISASENQTGTSLPSENVAKHADGTTINQRPASKALSPYSKSETAALMAACKKVIVKWREGNKAFQVLEAEGIHASAIAAAKKLSGSTSSLKRSGVLNTPEDVLAFEVARESLFPSLSTLLAFRIFVGLELGLPAESLDALTVPDISWSGPKTMRISYIKNRANGRQTALYKNSGIWSGPALLGELITALAPARAQLGVAGIWATPNVEGGQVSRWAAQTRVRTRFIIEHGLVDDFGAALSLDLRRLRTTWTAQKSREWNGLVTVDPNRTARVEGDHYLVNAASEDAIQQAIRTAQQELEILAHVSPKVVATEEELVAGVSNVRTEIELDSKSHAREWDMFAAICADPFAGEHGKKGAICPATVWACLSCRLSFFTPAHLPNLIRLRAHMRARFQEMPLNEWMATYSSAYVLLTKKVLPAFPDSQVEAAEKQVSTEEPLAIPGTEVTK